MRIIIATGIYPPEVGGPALYAEGVKNSLERMGHSAPLVLFGGLRHLPSGVRHALYTLKLIFSSIGSDAIFAFDTYSVGVPAACVGMMLRTPVIIRVGGDFVWESYVERTKNFLPLPAFYESMPTLNLKERIAYRLVRWMLRHATLAFNTRWLLNIWQRVYAFDESRARVVENEIPQRLSPLPSDQTMLLYGRTITLKNGSAFKRALSAAHAQGVNLQLEEGAFTRDALFERIRRAHAVVVPSISDVAPNSVIDAIRCGKPFLLTKYSGYAELYKEYGVIVDPLSEEDMARGIEALADPQTYAKLCANIKQFTTVRTYEDVTREMLALI